MIKKHFLNKKINSNSDNVLSRFLHRSLPVIAFALLLLLLHTFSITVFASSTVSGDLPYIVPNFQSVNTAMNETLMQSAYQQLINQNKVQSDDTVLFYVTDLRSNLGQYEWNQMFYICNPVVQTDVSGQYNYLTTNMTLSCEYYGQIEFKWNNTFRNIGQSYSNVSILGNTSTIDISQGSYTPRYPFYLVGNDIKYGDIVVFTNTVNQGNTIVQGHATAPSFETSFLGQNADFGASISNSTMPSQPTVNNYTWNTYSPPTVDTSTLETLVESLIDIVKYNATYITEGIQGTLSTIIANIQAYGQYVGGIIAYVGKSIITNIQNGIQNLYENIVSLFEPLLNSINELIDGISQKIDYISQPFDASVIQDAFESTALHSDIDSISQFTSTAFDVFDSTSEPNEFKIPLHLENIALLNISQVQYIDLGCMNSVKTAIRAVMWCLTTFSLLYTVIDAIPSYISGGDE